MSVRIRRPGEHPEIALSSFWQYFVGWVVTTGLLGVSYLLVVHQTMDVIDLVATISLIALLTTVAKLVFLFHLDFSETQRWNTLTLVLNVPLLILSIGLTSWMFETLYDRVMMH